MKSKTVTKYETKDGRNFDKEEAAVGHEINCALTALAEPDARLTAAEAIRLMAANVGTFAALFKELAE